MTETNNTTRLRGTITTWIAERGFGFGQCGQDGDLFIHTSDLVGPRGQIPHVNQPFECDLETTAKGPRGRNVLLLPADGEFQVRG